MNQIVCVKRLKKDLPFTIGSFSVRIVIMVMAAAAIAQVIVLKKYA